VTTRTFGCVVVTPCVTPPTQYIPGGIV
jgi:hypothetical protein